MLVYCSFLLEWAGEKFDIIHEAAISMHQEHCWNGAKHYFFGHVKHV